MKHTIFVLFLFTIITGWSQNWQPVNPEYVYFYKTNSDQFISNTVLVDSSAEVNGHQVYYLNTLFLPCDTCETTDCGGPYVYDFCLSNFPNFLQKEIHLTSDNKTLFKNENSFVIFQLEGLNQSWVFDTLQNISATINQITFEELFQGVSDSVKYIELSNNKMIKLSKNYGIIEFPDFYYSEQTYYLQGGRILDLEFGEEVPDFWDFYDYQIGDVFCTAHTTHYTSPDGTKPDDYAVIYKTEILAKEILEDKFIYARYVKRCYFGSNIPEYKIYYDTIARAYSPTDFCNTFPGMIDGGQLSEKACITLNPFNNEPSLHNFNEV